MPDRRLSPGPSRLSREQVAENQRWRMLSAAAELLAREGYLGVTSSGIARRAGVSPSTFYEHFEGTDDCLAATHELVAEALLELVGGACGGEAGSPERIAAGVEAAIGFVDAEPRLAAALGPQLAAAVPAVAARRRELVRRLALIPSQEPSAGAVGTGVEWEVRLLVLGGALALLGGWVGEAGRSALAGAASQLSQLLVRCLAPSALG